MIQTKGIQDQLHQAMIKTKLTQDHLNENFKNIRKHFTPEPLILLNLIDLNYGIQFC
jgi:hypothetical protein